MYRLNKNFIIIPALDIYKDGFVVRLKQGDFNAEKSEYAYTAVKKIKEYLNEGARRIHTIDLAGAENGAPVNTDIFKQIGEIIRAFENKSGEKIMWQVGGGIRSEADVERVFSEYKADKIILGGAAIERELSEKYISKLIKKYGSEKFIIDIAVDDSLEDSRKKVLKKNGWKEDLLIPIDDAFVLLKQAGIKEALVTSKKNDGMDCGPNIDLAKYVQNKGFSVILSGGVASIQDCLNAYEGGLDNIVVGRALCENKFTFLEATKAVKIYENIT